MCIICVEIMREKITMKDAIDKLVNEWKSDMDPHLQDIINANAESEEKLKKVIKEGYKKERWI